MWRIAVIGGILLTAVTNLLTPLQARKLVHIGCGITLAHINVPDAHLKAIIIAVAVISIIIFKTVPLRFGIKDDAGIIWYNLIVLLFAVFGLPLRVLLPVFIIDPVACIVGISTRSRKWCGNKTVYGTVAAGIASYFSLYYVRVQQHRILLSCILPITEGIMRQHDNIGISVVVLLYYCAAQHFGWTVDLNLVPSKNLVCLGLLVSTFRQQKHFVIVTTPRSRIICQTGCKALLSRQIAKM